MTGDKQTRVASISDCCLSDKSWSATFMWRHASALTHPAANYRRTSSTVAFRNSAYSRSLIESGGVHPSWYASWVSPCTSQGVPYGNQRPLKLFIKFVQDAKKLDQENPWLNPG